MSKYVSGKKASELLQVHQRTLHNWDRSGKIEVLRTPGGIRRYNVEKYLKEYQNVVEKEEINLEAEGKLSICYVRVSTHGQREDLENQIKYMKKLYPKHIIIQDIESGINFNRKGLRKIIKYAIAGKIEEVVVAYKDRLTRFGFELIEDLIKEYSDGKVIIVNKKEEETPEVEIAKTYFK